MSRGRGGGEGRNQLKRRVLLRNVLQQSLGFCAMIFYGSPFGISISAMAAASRATQSKPERRGRFFSVQENWPIDSGLTV